MADNDDWAALAAFVKQRREELELSIKAAAEAAGVGRTWWSQLEAGRRRLKTGEWAVPNVRGDYLARAARVLEVPLAELRAVLTRRT